MTQNKVPHARLDDLKTWFNENKDRPRLVALMSPTCGFCLVGHQAVRTYNSWLPNADFVTKRIWVPMMAPDTHDDADREAATTNDPRITDMYDGEHVVGRTFRDVLGLAAVAWDTYLLYPAGIEWTDALPPQPVHVQYQLYPAYAENQSKLFTPSDFWWQVVEAVGGSRQSYNDAVPALAAWLNDDPKARVGLPIPEKYTTLPHEVTTPTK